MSVTLRNFQRIHLVGVGGSGMSGIAEVLLSSGYAISGSDLKATSVTERLRNMGATIQEGHAPENVHGAHVVVVSSAVAPDNVEISEAHRLKIPVIPRAEMLAELMRLKYGIAVAGAHGKTTTTSMTAAVLAAAGLDPTFVVGGRVNHAGANARVGQGEYMVVEADESDRSFLLLAPVIAVVTTIDREHMGQYNSLEEIQETFLQFINRVPFDGSVVLCLDEPNIQAILPRVNRPVVTYGTSSQADLVIADVKLKGLSSEFRLKYRDGSRHLRPASPAGNPQRAQRSRGGRRRPGAQCPAGPGSRRPGIFLRRRAAIRDQGKIQRRHAHRRLRPPSRRNSRHAGSRARLRIQAPAGAVPTAPLFAHAVSLGRFPQLVPPRGRGRDHGYLCRRRIAPGRNH